MKLSVIRAIRITLLILTLLAICVSTVTCFAGLDEFRQVVEVKNWYYMSEGKKIYITLPATLDTSLGVELTLYTDEAGEITDTEAVTTRAANYFIKARVDGKELYAYDDNGFLRDESMRSRIECLIDVPDGEGGYVLSITYVNYTGGDFKIPAVYAGSLGAIFRYYLVKNIFNLTVCAVILALSVFSIAMYFYMKRKKLADVRLFDCALFLFLSSVMGLTDSSLGILMFNQSAFVCYLSFYSFMLIPVPLAYMVMHTGKMSEYRVLHMIPPVLGLNVILQTFAELYALSTLTRMNFITLILMTVSVLAALYCLVREYRLSASGEVRYALEAFGAIGVISVVCIVLYVLLDFSGYLEIFDVGIILFSVFVMYRLLNSTLRGYRYRRDAEIEKNMSTEDAMTGLKNRRGYDLDMDVLERESKESHENITLLYLDVNGLKTVNDVYGHDEGDNLIKGAAYSIRDAFSGLGKTYRLGGDEFACVLIGCKKSIGELKAVLEKEVSAYNEKNEHKLSIALGYSFLMDDEGNMKRFSDWKREADDDMYRNKAIMKKELQSKVNEE